DGRGLWSTGMFHCDHAYGGDIDPQRPGLEVYYGYERPKPINGVCLVDARTGEVIWGLKERTYHVHSSGLCSDIDQAHPGMECYSGERDYPMRRLHAANGELLATESAFDVGLSPRAVYWDADAQRELLHGGRVYDYDTGLTHLAGVAGHQAAWADIFGDWREEIVTSVAGELRIYTTTVPATDQRVTLMQDPIYRADVAHLAMGYAQVPMTSYCLDARGRP
ncbi:MAG: silent information regulator protein Sir2, partial [Armatimonadota bacterium]